MKKSKVDRFIKLVHSGQLDKIYFDYHINRITNNYEKGKLYELLYDVEYFLECDRAELEASISEEDIKKEIKSLTDQKKEIPYRIIESVKNNLGDIIVKEKKFLDIEELFFPSNYNNIKELIERVNFHINECDKSLILQHPEPNPEISKPEMEKLSFNGVTKFENEIFTTIEYIRFELYIGAVKISIDEFISQFLNIIGKFKGEIIENITLLNQTEREYYLTRVLKRTNEIFTSNFSWYESSIEQNPDTKTSIDDIMDLSSDIDENDFYSLISTEMTGIKEFITSFIELSIKENIEKSKTDANIIIKSKLKKCIKFLSLVETIVSANEFDEFATKLNRLLLAATNEALLSNPEQIRTLLIRVNDVQSKFDEYFIQYPNISSVINKEDKGKSEFDFVMLLESYFNLCNPCVSELKSDHGALIHTRIKYNSNRLDEFKESIESVYGPPMSASQKTEQFSKNTKKVESKRTFPELLVHSKQYELADKLKSEFKDKKGIAIRLMIEVLKSYDPSLIDIGAKSDLCESLKAYFNRDTGTRQGVFPSGFDIKNYKDDLKSTKAKIDLILKSISESQ